MKYQDISGWLAPHIVKIKNHVYPHAFKVFLSDYKNCAQDKKWLPLEEPITVLTNVLEGFPPLIDLFTDTAAILN